MQRTSTFCVAAIVLAGLVVTSHGQQPTFRAGVEVTTIDVSVVDDNGKPVADLKAGEFRVRVNGRDRRVVRADWVPLTPAPGSPPPPPPPAGYTTNVTGSRGRLILIAVDQPNIRSGGTQLLRSSLDRFVDQLEPADRAAAVAIGQGGVSTGFTTDRAAIKRAIATMTGSMRLPEEVSPRYQIGVSEAFEIMQDNQATLSIVYARECLRDPMPRAIPLPTVTSPCLEEIKMIAPSIQQSAVNESLQSITALRALLDGLRQIEAPKTLVLVTEGSAAVDQAGIVELGTLAAAAKTSLYILRLADQTPGASSQGSPRPSVLVAERQMRSTSAELLASVTGGEVLNVIGTGRPVIDRLEREVSGYYLVGVESDPSDSDGKAHPVGVQVSRPRTIVRARREYVEGSPERRAAGARDPIAEAIRSPLLETGLVILATASPVRDDDPSRVRLLLSAEVGSGYTGPQEANVGYVITDSRNAVVVNKAAQGRLPAKSGGGAPLVFTAEETLPPGDYVWKLAVTEGARVGSIEHALHTGPVSALSARPPRTTDASPASPGPEPAARPSVGIVPKAFRASDAIAPEILARFRATVPAESRVAFDAGVTALQGGDASVAEQRLKEAMQAGPAVGPLVYLGVAFAASGRDPDAVGVWQVALTDGSSFAEIYDWLVEALIRTRDIPQARTILREAVERWPGDARFASRRAELLP